MTHAMNIFTLPGTDFDARHNFPSVPGIYFALSATDEVLYIGRAVDIAARWAAHHRAKQLRRLGCARLAWLEVDEPSLLPGIETAMIAHFKPRLNGAPVEDQAKKLASLRLDEAVVDNIDAVMEQFYRQVGGIPPSRNAQMEAWIIEGVERMQTRLTAKPVSAGPEERK